jgi:hypothetical protein
MRYLIIIIVLSVCSLWFSCIKKGQKSTTAEITYKDFRAWKVAGRDTAVMTLGYTDWDGDLFRNSTSDGPNTILRTYVFNVDSNKFIEDEAFSYILIQPGDGFYKGKSIKGDIILPLKEFRPNDNVKITKYDIFMLDMKGDKTNVVTTPQFTFTF